MVSDEKVHWTEKFFYWLFRINAVGLFLLLVFAAINLAWVFSDPYDDVIYDSDHPDRFGNENDRDDGDYKAEQYETTNGVVQAYRYGAKPNMDRGEVSTGMTLIHPATGRQIEIMPRDSGQVLASFDTIENEAGQAVAYIARISTKDGYAKGRAKLVVGSFESLKQVEIAKNAPYLDAKMLTAEDRLALVFWSDEVTARMILLDLTSMSIERAEEVALPPSEIIEAD